MNSRNQNSAQGEVNAIRGYRNQYEYSACSIFHLMQNGGLEWISISDPDAGFFDDLVVKTSGTVIATQICPSSGFLAPKAT